jgi:hypothetical protein
MSTRHIQKIIAAQARLADMFGEWTTGDIYRSPAESGGRVGAATLVYANVPAQRRPMTEDPRMARLMPMLRAPLNSARVGSILKLKPGVDIRVGDRWKEGGVYYHVEGVATFHTGTLAALTEPKQ